MRRACTRRRNCTRCRVARCCPQPLKPPTLSPCSMDATTVFLATRVNPTTRPRSHLAQVSVAPEKAEDQGNSHDRTPRLRPHPGPPVAQPLRHCELPAGFNPSPLTET